MKTQVGKKEIAPAELASGEHYLVDVRTPVEFEEKHLAQAELHPLHELDASVVRERAAGRPIAVICQSGNRAGQAARKLDAAGLDQVSVLAGGVTAWEAAGLPLERGKKGLSLERQVRIAAGTLVLAGVLGSLLIHPAWVVLSGFVGAGLIFAGVTDWCGMGLLLARMPWNKRAGVSCGTARS